MATDSPLEQPSCPLHKTKRSVREFQSVDVEHDVISMVFKESAVEHIITSLVFNESAFTNVITSLVFGDSAIDDSATSLLFKDKPVDDFDISLVFDERDTFFSLWDLGLTVLVVNTPLSSKHVFGKFSVGTLPRFKINLSP